MAVPTPRRAKQPEASPPDGWQSWGQHVLSELERLSHAVESVREQVAEMRQDGRVAQHSSEIEELKSWRKAHDDVATPSQLQKKLDTVDDLKVTQIKAYTLMAVVQVLLTAVSGIVLWYLKK